MFDKIGAAFTVFQKGQIVANPAAWKAGQVGANVLLGFLAALVTLAKTFGYDIHISDQDLVHIAGAVAAIYGLFNAGVTVASSDKIGLQAKQPDSGFEDVPY
jgi:hypothetical protein